MPSVGVELAGGMPMKAPCTGPVQFQIHTLSALGGVIGDSITRSSGEEIPQ
jgi:hypothetical protein